MKHLIVTFSDGSRWLIPARFIAEHCAKFFSSDLAFNDEVERITNDDVELLTWARFSMAWSDVVKVAAPVRAISNYHTEWSRATMSIQGHKE